MQADTFQHQFCNVLNARRKRVNDRREKNISVATYCVFGEIIVEWLQPEQVGLGYDCFHGKKGTGTGNL